MDRLHNDEGLHEALDDLPRAEYEQLKYRDKQHLDGGRHLTEPPADPVWTA